MLSFFLGVPDPDLGVMRTVIIVGAVYGIMFVFLMTVVLMNLLNGLAVSDIHKIQKEVDY